MNRSSPSTPPERLPAAAEGRATVAFVVPLYNEAEVLPLLVEAIEAYRADHPFVVQVVFVDDGSTDGTAALVARLTYRLEGYVLVRFSRNFGHQLAVTAGLDVAEADAVVLLDADLQDPLEVVTTFVEKWREGYDVVYGVRTSREGESWAKRGLAALFYRVFRWASGLDLPLDTGDFRLMAWPVVEAYRRLGEQQPFVRGLVAWLGFRQVGVEYRRAPRAAGRTKYPLRKMLRLAGASLTSFSDKPLRFAVRIGLGAACVAVLGLVWVVADKLVWGTPVLGWASILFSIFFFGGLQLFFLGIAGLYLIRVFEEVKGRPRYVVESLWRSGRRDPSDERAGPPEERAAASHPAPRSPASAVR